MVDVSKYRSRTAVIRSGSGPGCGPSTAKFWRLLTVAGLGNIRGATELNKLPVKLRCKGSGWDPGPGSPTDVSWAGKPAKTFAPAKDFDGVLVAGEWPQRDNGLNGRFASGCSGIINASQGGVTRTQRVSTPAVGAVLFADRNRVFLSGDVICGGELFTLEHTGGLVVMVDTKVPLKLYYAHDGSIGIPDGIVAKGLCLPLEPASRGRVHFTLSKDRQSWEGTHVAKC